MIRLRMNDAQQQGLSFLMSQRAYFEPVTYKKVYPEFQYPQLIPVDTSADEWAPAVVFSSQDSTGKAEFFSHRSKDMPLADVTREMFATPVYMAGLGYDYSLQELKAAQRLNQALTSDKSDAARRGFHEFVETAAMTGFASKGWTGITNNADVTRVDAIADGTGATPADKRLWANKTADQMLRDINDALKDVYTDSNTVEVSNTVLLPDEAWLALGTTRIAGTNSMAWDLIMKNNAYTMKTNLPLTIRGVRQLQFAGTDGVGRMVVYNRAPDVLKMHIPMMHQFMDPFPRTSMLWQVDGIFRLAGLEIRRPSAVRYVDGITAAAA